MRIKLIVAVLVSLFSCSVAPMAFADNREEHFVEMISKKALSTAQRGNSGNEIKRFVSLVEDFMAVEAMVKSSFAETYNSLSLRQRQAVEEFIISNTAETFAQALDGSERLTVLGSTSADIGIVVNTTIAANVVGLKEGLTLDWTVIKVRGQDRILDINIAGRSAIVAQRELISSLMKISNGNMAAVIDGLMTAYEIQ